MAGEEEGFQEKTEEASPKKRQDARKEGRVAQSRELVSAILMLLAVSVLYAAAHWSFRGLGSLFELSFMELARIGTQEEWTDQTVSAMAGFAYKGFLWVVGPVAVAGAFAAIIGNIFQFGFLWSTKPLQPNFKKLNPMNGLKRIFGVEGLFELFKASIKFLIVGCILYFIFVRWIGESGLLWGAESQVIVVAVGGQLITTVLIIAAAMAVMSAGDFAFQKFRFEKKLMMTKQEVKDERKQIDGNPHIKARIRAIQRKMSNSRMLEAVKTADVVVTNPTHYAVALVYDRESMDAPRVVAKGVDHMAQKIKKIARENGVPCVENVPLARAMYKALKIGQFISRDLYNAVAEVLAYVYRLRGDKQ